jgi:hypothetical protein
MERQRREQWATIDEEGPSRERISGERTMGRQRRTYQRRAYDGKAAKNVSAESVRWHRTLYAETLSPRLFLVDGRPLLPSLPSHRTLSADTFFAAFPSHALR